MPNPTTPSHDSTRAELLRAATETLRQVAPDVPADAGRLLASLYAGLSTAELAGETPDIIATATASLWSLAQDRQPGTVRLRVIPPGSGSGPHAVVEIVTDDMPFLVDSALAVLTKSGRVVRKLLHPILPMSRDTAGRLQGIGSEAAAPAGCLLVRESLMHIECTGVGHAAREEGDEWAGLEASLRAALADVRAATEDHAAMLALLGQAEAELAASPVGVEAAPAREFLRWLTDDNFVLLGHRRLTIGEGEILAAAAEENLGLLRNPAVVVFDTLHDRGTIPPDIRATLLASSPLSVAKANLRSTVHRPQHGDVVITRIFDAAGKVTAFRLFFGLFAATAYTRNPRSIPLLAQKVNAILASAGVDPESHDGRALRHVLDTWPRDELLQAPEEAILAGARRALDLRLRPRSALVVRQDPFGRFVSAIAWLPRDTFDTALRERVGGMLARAYAGHLAAAYIALGDEPLARVNYVVSTTPGSVPVVDIELLETAIAQAARDFRDRLGEALTQALGEAQATSLLARWADAFPAAYRDTASAGQAVADLQLAECAVVTGRAATRLDRPFGSAADRLVLRLVQPGGPLPLVDALPLLQSIGLRAIEEVPHHLEPAAGAPRVVLHGFIVQAQQPVDEAAFPVLLAALDALLDGRAEADGFNRLVLLAGLDWRECWLLRGLYRWLKQVGFGFSQESVEAALAAHPEAARVLVDVFHATLAPPAQRGASPADAASLEARWTACLDAVANPDEDRILNRLMTVLRSVVRTNYFEAKPYLALKIASAEAGDMPLPRPWREIFVHSPRMEGCHLRAGPVARGGIRWSDRREDFRTEILSLMKAQRFKNVVIVPTGAKGGFVLKQAPAATDREAFMAEGIACYRILINAILDLADNVEQGRIVTPADIVRRDGDDPYVVVAADKGTATFSDIANAIAQERGFWIGDAFASGGSHGYDHKEMGITARGAWVMIARHFAALGLDIQADPFTCVGVGDMSGDVFGNGMLISRKTRLLAAFDHRHIFIDPDPDPEVSYTERARLFALPRSSWDDYDRARISAGGGVYSRNDKRIALSPRACELLGIAERHAEPAAVVQAILRAPVDLLYFGGIGTYVKAASESQAEAGDRANDALRVNGAQIRARVIGEGANLALTQAGRVEYARQGAGGAGGRIDTDALDNSAGVSTSDHEVNIKIALADAERAGALTAHQRDELLAAMTDDVAEHVLRDNHLQFLAVSLEEQEKLGPSHLALIAALEAAGVLDRAVAGLPDTAALSARMNTGDTLLRPEIATVLPVAKLWLEEAVLASPLPDDPAFEQTLLAYFPAELRRRFPIQLERHHLRRELIATALANAVVNRLGLVALARLAADRGPVPVARAAWAAAELFDLEAAYDAIDAAPASVPARLGALTAVRRLQEATAGYLMAAPEFDLQPLGAQLAALRPGIAELTRAATAEAAAGPAAQELREAGLPDALAALVAAAPFLAQAPVVVRLAADAAVPPSRAVAAWREVGQALGFDALDAASSRLVASGPFHERARAALFADLTAAQRELAAADLRGANPAADAAATIELVRDVAAAPDLAGFTLASRALAALAARAR
ncbi:MAG: NAD-glutamate dehydrogenase [Rhodospirillales bacterium]|nr:NAD-glutamate dehydrogenase [Rhodospirillales bacterium]